MTAMRQRCHRRKVRLLLLAAGCGGALLGRVSAQIVLTLETQEATVSPNREDVKSIGMGRTQIANGKMWNGMMYNPALLARTRTSIEALGVQASLPLNTFEAAAFLRDNYSEFKTGGFVTSISKGVRAYQNAGGDPQAQAAAIRQINSGLAFINRFQDRVLGSVDNPKIQGIAVTPAIQVQLGNLGFSLHAALQEAFVSYVGDMLSRLYALQLPENLETLTGDQIATLLDILTPLVDPVTSELNFKQAVPQTFAIGYIDIVATAGYGYQINRDLSVGANLKIVNRRISTRVINADNYQNIFTELRKDFASSTTGFSMDLGGLYRLRSTGTEFGASLQNIIPLPKLTGTAELSAVAYDDNGAALPVLVKIPIEFSAPILFNLGVTHPLTPQWDVSFDWVDVAAQDEGHASYVSRFRLGSEYRLDAIPGSLGIAFRGGVTDRKLAAGLGLNLFRVVQIDGAYARDNALEDNAIYAQLRLGW